MKNIYCNEIRAEHLCNNHNIIRTTCVKNFQQKNQHVYYVHTDFMVRIIELIRLLYCTLLFKNHHVDSFGQF